MDGTKIAWDKMTDAQRVAYVHDGLKYKSPFPNWKNAFEKLKA